MKRLVGWIQGFALALGGPGLFLIGFLDSSFLSFPEVNDLLVIVMVTQHKERLLYYNLMATLGSVAGCLALYYIARRGGEAFMRKRFKAHHVEGGLKLFQKYGLLVVVVPALLPPPAPFKIFVLLAGVAAIPVWQFTTAIFIARFVRYGDLHTRQGHVERAHRLTRRCVCRCADHRSRANGKRRARRRSTRDRDGRSSRLSGWCFEGHWLRRTDCSANGDVHGTRDARWVARRARTGRAAATCRRCGSEREERKKAVSRQESQEAHGVIILEAVVRAPAVIL